MRAWLQDLARGFLVLRRDPGYAALAIVALVLGIGANLAIFSLIDGLMLRALPYAAAERLAVFSLVEDASLSKRQLDFVAERQRSFAAVAAYSGWGFTLTGSGEAAALEGARTIGPAFELLGVAAQIGRTLRREDSEPGSVPVAVLSHGLWQERFGADADVIGRAIELDGDAVTVVGVMPASFRFPSGQARIWLPTRRDPADSEDYTTNYLTGLARLSDGTSLDGARAELRAIASAWHSAGGDAVAQTTDVSLVPLRAHLLGHTAMELRLLLGAVVVVLAIALANVACLQLTRASRRAQDLAVRRALGSSGARIARELMMESVALALVGGLLGTIVALYAARLLALGLPVALRDLAAVGPDPTLIGVALGMSVLSGVLAGAIAARRFGWRSGTAIALSARGATASGGQRRALSALVAAQLALGVVLLSATGLLLLSYWRLAGEHTGFETRGVLAAELSPPSGRLATPASQVDYWQRVETNVSALPGVQAVGAIHLTPLGGSNWNPGLTARSGVAAAEPLAEVHWRAVTPGYFDAVGLPLLRGRGFAPADRADSIPVTVINRTLAERLAPDGDAIGMQVRTAFDSMQGGDGWVEVIGIVGDSRDMALGLAPMPQIYRPHAQWPLTSLTLMVRTDGDPMALAGDVRRAVWAVDDDVPIGTLRAFGDLISATTAAPRFLAGLVGTFGVLALVLATLGVSGLIAYGVDARRREIGLRLALGASPRQTLRWVLGDALRIACLGSALGVVGAIVASRGLASHLHATAAVDPLVLAAAAAALVAIALLAAWGPARHAARIDPRESLAE